jgi:hypothetical protein
MGRQHTSDKGSEKFVQWKEPLQSNGVAPNNAGDASASHGRKTRQCTSGAGGTSHQSARGEEPRHAGSPGTHRLEAGVAGRSPPRAGSNCTNPPARFVPPRRMSTPTNSVPAATPNGDRVARHRAQLLQTCQDDSATFEGTSAHQKRIVPQGTDCSCLHVLCLEMRS